MLNSKLCLKFGPVVENLGSSIHFTCSLCKILLFDEFDLFDIQIHDESCNKVLFRFEKAIDTSDLTADCPLCQDLVWQINSPSILKIELPCTALIIH